MPIVTLLTDFGLQDSYVAQMKGVVLSIAQSCTLVDISHSIAAQNVLAGAAVLREAAVCFPPRTVHVAVVDPGVGTSRRLVAAKIADQFFVLPDNGLLTHLLRDFALEQAVELTNRRFWRSTISSTFHGRDIMAPVAAHLATGTRLSDLGSPIETLLRLTEPLAEETTDGISGLVVSIDHFGNAITNIPGLLVEQVFANIQFGDCLEIELGQRVGSWPWSRTYGTVAAGKGLALLGSQGYLELAVNCGSAAASHKISVGDSLRIRSVKFLCDG